MRRMRRKLDDPGTAENRASKQSRRTLSDAAR